jgi:hypothetical protein
MAATDSDALPHVAELTGTVTSAVSAPTDDHLAALRPLLSDDVRAAGPFVTGVGSGAVLAAIADQPMPALSMATWEVPQVATSEHGDEIVVRGALPPGLQIAAVRLVLRTTGGRLVELLQEVEMPGTPPAVPLDLDESISAVLDGAFDRHAPVVVAYVDGAGAPHISYRGTVQGHGNDTIAMWIRDPNGGLLRAIETNPLVALLYRDDDRTQYEIAGRAHRVDDARERDRIYDRSPAFERGLDPARRGVAVAIDVDSVRGGAPGAAIHQRRDAGVS